LIIDKIRIDKKMKHKLCAPIDEDNLCGNRWHNENGDENDTGLEDKKDQTERNSTYKGCIIEYLLVCTKCKEQTGYSYPLFALQNAWEHILNTEHNVVTILEIVYDRGIIHENKRLNIELMIK
jgi:hypothetical protein